MRIIAGALGGHQFDSPHGHRTHPMSEKMRGALFNALGDIQEMTVLDVFSGSGAVAFEAISRVAKEVTSIEVDKKAHRIMEQNVQRLGLTRSIKAIRANASGWSSNNVDSQFDIVVCDPPYDDLQLPIIQKLARHVAPKGLLVLSWPGQIKAPELPELRVVQTSAYGDAQLIFYKH